MTDPQPDPEELAAEANRTFARLQAGALWVVEWLREPEPVVRLREGGDIDGVFELVKGLADLTTVLATQIGESQSPQLTAEDVLQKIAGATNDPDLARSVAVQWLNEDRR